MSKEAVNEVVEHVTDGEKPSNAVEERPSAGSLSEKEMEAVIGGFIGIRVGRAIQPVVMCQYGRAALIK